MECVTYCSGFPVAHFNAIKPSFCSRRYQNLGAPKRSKNLDFSLSVSSPSSSFSSSSDSNQKDGGFFLDVRWKQESICSSSLPLYNESFLRNSSSSNSSKRCCNTQLVRVFRSSRTDGNESRRRFLEEISSGGQVRRKQESAICSSSLPLYNESFLRSSSSNSNSSNSSKRCSNTQLVRVFRSSRTDGNESRGRFLEVLEENSFGGQVRRKQESAICSSSPPSYNESFLRSSSSNSSSSRSSSNSSRRFCNTQLLRVFPNSRTDRNESRGRFLARGSFSGQGSEFDEAKSSTSSVSELTTPEKNREWQQEDDEESAATKRSPFVAIPEQEQDLRQQTATEWRGFAEEDRENRSRELEGFGEAAAALLAVKKSNRQEEENLSQKREWQEYKDAVERQDLGRALQALEVLNRFESDTAESSTFVQQNGTIDVTDKDGKPFFSQVLQEGKTSPRFRSVIVPRRECLKMLDTCQSAIDLQLVGQAYNWLQLRGLLPNFGKFRGQVFENSEGGRVVTAADMLASAGLTDKNLSPKKWGLSGNSGIQLVAGIAVFSFLVNNSIDIRPFAFLVVALGLLDATYLGGTGQAQLLSLWPPYKRRVLVHEAGHVLVAYLLGCPVRSVVLDAMQALKSGIQGQAGTQFWDESLDRDLRQDQLTRATLDMYCIVLFAGVAAEALVYGDAEGGESDENLYKALISQLQPPWGPGKMSNQARWAVLQAFNLLKKHRKVLDALVKALGENLALGSLVETIETAMAAQE